MNQDEIDLLALQNDSAEEVDLATFHNIPAMSSFNSLERGESSSSQRGHVGTRPDTQHN